MRFVYDDGGRARAGYKNGAGDCAARAIAIATERPYQEVYDALNVLAQRERPRARTRMSKTRSSARNGVHKATFDRYMSDIGWIWTPTMRIGEGCKVHMREDELPAGRLIVSLSKHWSVVIDGVIHDTYDPSRNGTRCVYGYWRPSARLSAAR